MATPLLLVENFCSAGLGRQFPLHAIAGDEEAAGFEAWHVADGRRSSLDCWQAITPNVQHTLTITCDRVRGADCAILDRGHNFAGLPVFIESSMDNANWQVAVSPIIPTANLAAPLSNANGVTTEEGAWGIEFPTVVGGLYWRLRIPAMGVGLVPQVVGLWIGKSYQPPANFLNPWSEDQDRLLVAETASEWGWKGRGPAAAPNAGAFNTKLLTDDEYDVARYHVAGHYGRGRPMWICYDQAQADRMFCAIRPGGDLGYSYLGNWFPRQGRIPYEEHEVLRAA
jgi:hypothetical protein